MIGCNNQECQYAWFHTPHLKEYIFSVFEVYSMTGSIQIRKCSSLNGTTLSHYLHLKSCQSFHSFTYARTYSGKGVFWVIEHLPLMLLTIFNHGALLALTK